MRIFLFKVIFFFSLTCFAQKDSVLVTIDNEPFYYKEFERLFSKNANLVDLEEQKNIDHNLNLFIDYQLKIKEAENQGLDTLPTIIKQLESFRNQLAQQYLFDTEVTQHLIKEAYDRLKYEREVDYILIRLDSEASPKDTLKAYQKALEFKEKLEDSGDFEELSLAYSEDPAVVKNKGKFGWVSVFQTVYEFENAVYNTKVGEISDPFRSQFGYHVIRVNKERKSEGEISISHILIKKSSDNQEAAKEKINKIYKNLEDGVAFSELARQYSEDKSTAGQGGKMRTFKKANLRSKVFENQAFALTEENPLSAPFETEEGWHIIKLNNKFPVGSLEQESNNLKEKIKRNNRSVIIKDSLIKKLAKQYQIQTEGPGIDFFKNKLGKDFIEKAEKDLPDQVLFKIKDDSFSYADFLEKLKTFQKYNRKAPTPHILDHFFKNSREEFLINYAKKDLEKNNSSFANEIRDYRNGILIYELMDKNIFRKSDDSIALKNHYLLHKKEFVSPKQYEVLVVSSPNKKDVRKARKFLRKGNSSEEIKDISSNLMISSGVFKEKDSQLPENFKKEIGISSIKKENGMFLASKTLQVFPSEQKDFEAVRGRVLNHYQKNIEKDFVDNLRNKYQIKPNHQLIKVLKEKI